MTVAQKQSSSPLLTAYNEIRAYTETLCKPLEIEDYIPQPVIDVSPPKWNIAHTTWFFEEMILKRFASDYCVFDSRFGFLFNSYYNSIGERTQRDQRGALSRPTVAEVFAYRHYVDAAMCEFLNHELLNEISDLVQLGLQHEQQHQELFLTDLKYIFSCNPLFPVYDAHWLREEECETPSNEWITMPGGNYDIGFASEGYCFDNELGRHQVFLPPYSLRKTLATNAEFLEFVNDGGYNNFALWHAEGWDWVQRNQIQSPLYWQQRDDEWLQFTLAGLRPIKWDAPVCHVSFYEAAAFAEWKGKRLATEFEWEAAATQSSLCQFDWGLRWEWTNSAYLPYPNFTKAAGAVGEYNGKFMINQMVLRGASIATPPGHSRSTYRNFFHPHLRWQFAGIRLAQ